MNLRPSCLNLQEFCCHKCVSPHSTAYSELLNFAWIYFSMSSGLQKSPAVPLDWKLLHIQELNQKVLWDEAPRFLSVYALGSHADLSSDILEALRTMQCNWTVQVCVCSHDVCCIMEGESHFLLPLHPQSVTHPLLVWGMFKIYYDCLDKKKYYSKRHIIVATPQNVPFTLIHVDQTHLLLSDTAMDIFFHESLWDVYKNMVNAAAECHPMKSQIPKNVTGCPYPPYSPCLAPRDFWLFSKVKITMKNKCLELFQNSKADTTGQLKIVKKDSFQKYLFKWQEKWDKCFQSEGEYSICDGLVVKCYLL